MAEQAEGREVIPGGEQEFGYEHLFPIARLLIQRGHLPLGRRDEYGFTPTPSRMLCRLTRSFTDEDWDAINERFVVPNNVVYHHGLIRDNDNGVDMIGCDEVVTTDGPISATVWEARQDWSDLPADVASAAPDVP